MDGWKDKTYEKKIDGWLDGWMAKKYGLLDGKK